VDLVREGFVRRVVADKAARDDVELPMPRNVFPPLLVTMLMTPPWKSWYSAEAPIALTWISCMMSALGKSQTPPFETAEMSTPSYWNWF
jgi:hypothetical protein